MAGIANDLVGTILGEAGGKTIAQRYQDMLGIASVVANRAAATRRSVQDVISAPKQFDAYGKALPAGVEKFDALARMAIDQVSKWGPVNNATFYSTPDAVSNLPTGLKAEDQTVAHHYFTDPQNRAISTATGYVTPDPEAMAMAYAPDETQASAALSTLGKAQKDRLGRQKIGIVDFDNIGLNPNFAARVKDFAKEAQALGLDLSVDTTNTRRTPQEQAAIQKAGFSKTPNSYHIPGFAVDISATQLNALDQPEATTQAAARALAEKYGFGLLNPSFDPAHIQANVPGLTARSLMSMPVDAFGNVQLSPEQALNVRMDSVPTPTARPEAETAIAQAMPAQSMSVPGTPDTAPDTNIGFFAGKPGQVAGVAPQSVQTASVTPNMSVASAASPQQSFAETPQSTAADALSAMASADDQSISEIAGTPVGPDAAPSTVAPSNAYATTNLPSVAPSVNPALQAAVAPALPTPTTITPRPVAVPQVTAPTIRAPQTRAPQSIPSGVQAAMDFHNGVNNAATATNGNTLTRDAVGNTYNYSPSFDVTTISDPTGRTVGVKQGKVSPDMAGPSAPSASEPGTSKGLFSGVGEALGGVFSKDNVSNAVVGGLGGLGGAAVGSLLGPVGSMIGSAIGRNLAVKNNPFASQPGTFTVNTFAGPMTFAAPAGGLAGLGGFPSAPKGAPGALGGTQSNRSMGDMRGMSPRAADAIGRGVGGLY